MELRELCAELTNRDCRRWGLASGAAVELAADREGSLMDHDRLTLDIDCRTCPARGSRCRDCVVTAVLGPSDFGTFEVEALRVLSDRGLIPPLADPRGRKKAG